MIKKKSLVLLLVVAIISTLFLTGCNSNKEEASGDSEIAKLIETLEEGDDFKGKTSLNMDINSKVIQDGETLSQEMNMEMYGVVNGVDAQFTAITNMTKPMLMSVGVELILKDNQIYIRQGEEPWVLTNKNEDLESTINMIKKMNEDIINRLKEQDSIKIEDIEYDGMPAKAYSFKTDIYDLSTLLTTEQMEIVEIEEIDVSLAIIIQEGKVVNQKSEVIFKAKQDHPDPNNDSKVDVEVMSSSDVTFTNHGEEFEITAPEL